MKETPLLMIEDMVSKTLDDSKTQTRRVFKEFGCNAFKASMKRLCLKIGVLRAWLPYVLKGPYGKPGDRLWVRETWSISKKTKDGFFIVYRQDWHNGPPLSCRRFIKKADLSNKDIEVAERFFKKPVAWHPSIHMPRWASRLTLEITDIHFERLKDITHADAKAEGIDLVNVDASVSGMSFINNSIAVDRFARLWNSINAERDGGAYAWEKNPWVWVIKFRRVEHGN